MSSSKLLIFYLTCEKREFTFPHFLEMINQSNRKNEWHLLILTHSHNEHFYKSEIDKLNNTYTENQLSNYAIARIGEHNNYLHKVDAAIRIAENFKFPFMMKCDNDIFLKSQTLDYMIDNLELLNSEKHLTLGPVLTTGIPGAEYFKEQFLDEDAKTHLENMYLKTVFYDRDGANYSLLNKNTIHSKKWEKDAFFDSVKNLKHHYKGIHPIRINNEAIQFLNQYIINNKSRFLENQEMDIIKDDNSPYLCNSIFSIKTETYAKLFRNGSLYVDQFEEVPLNKYAWSNNMNHLFVKNGFAIHMYYNWSQNHINREKEFCGKFFAKN